MQITDNTVNAAIRMLEVHRTLMDEMKDLYSKNSQRVYWEGLMDMAHIILSDNGKNGKDIRFNKDQNGRYRFRLVDLSKEADHETDTR